MIAMKKRKPKRDYSTHIPRRSVPEVSGTLEREMARQATQRETKFFGVKLPAEVLVNVILMQFFDLTEAERDAIVDRYVPRFEEMLGDEEAGGKAEERDSAIKDRVVVNVPDPKRRLVDPGSRAPGKRNGSTS